MRHRTWSRATGLLLLALLAGCNSNPEPAPASAAGVEPAAAADGGTVGLVGQDAAAGEKLPADSRVYQPQGGSRPASLREAYPDYQPGANDPELEAVARGRRTVEKRDVSLDEGGAETARRLVENIVVALDAADGPALDRNAVTYREFRDILWPEFPQSRPAANVPVNEAWDFLRHRNIAAFNRTAGDMKGRGFRVARFEVTGGTTEYTNFRLHEGVGITVANEAGETLEFTMIRGILECGGRFKVYSTRD